MDFYCFYWCFVSVFFFTWYKQMWMSSPDHWERAECFVIGSCGVSSSTHCVERQGAGEGVSTGSHCFHCKQRISFLPLGLTLSNVGGQLPVDPWLKKWSDFRKDKRICSSSLTACSEFHCFGSLHWHVTFKCLLTWAWAACPADYVEISSIEFVSLYGKPIAKATLQETNASD